VRPVMLDVQVSSFEAKSWIFVREE
jgi:hypothetical protein